jgi:hypothetical protein
MSDKPTFTKNEWTETVTQEVRRKEFTCDRCGRKIEFIGFGHGKCMCSYWNRQPGATVRTDSEGGLVIDGSQDNLKPTGARGFYGTLVSRSPAYEEPYPEFK